MVNRGEQNLDNLTREKFKILYSIYRRGDDRHMKLYRFKKIKVFLWGSGFIHRRIGDWNWIPTRRAIKYFRRIKRDQLRGRTIAKMEKVRR